MVVRSLEKESTMAKSFPVSMSSGTISLTNFGRKAIFLLIIYSSKPKVVKPTFCALDTWVFQFWVCNPWPWHFPRGSTLYPELLCRPILIGALPQPIRKRHNRRTPVERETMLNSAEQNSEVKNSSFEECRKWENHGTSLIIMFLHSTLVRAF